MSEFAERSREEYLIRTRVESLRRHVYGQLDPAASPARLKELVRAEQELEVVQRQRTTAVIPDNGLILSTVADAAPRRGAETTGIEAKIFVNMAHVPTSMCHLLDVGKTPLITCFIKATQQVNNKRKRRVRIRSFVDGYSAMAVSTVELAIGAEHTFYQLPTFFPERLQGLTELTRATLNVIVEDLDGATELHETRPIWLLARTTAPLAVHNPQTGQWQDLTPYLGAFVTPNAPSLMSFLREAARAHPDGQFVGYQGPGEGVAAQVEALYNALKSKGEITYVNSVISFNPQQGFATQRVRLPRESLADKEANCIDGTVLFASLLEGISINPAIVLVPGHAFLAWETWHQSNDWRYLETTMIGTNSFQEACASAMRTAQVYESSGQLTLLSLVHLRTNLGITPME